MNRLTRFEGHRFVGVRDTMRVYDCDDEAQFEDLDALVRAGDLVERNRLQAFAPDTAAEAANRGYTPVS